jgi:predicted dehydrogenase
VDAVYVATPPSSHAEYTRLAAGAGKPVYVEKPMAMGAAECESMIAACRSAGVPLFVAYYRRALPRFVEVKRLVDTGAVGDVRFVSIALSLAPFPDEEGGGPLPWRVVPEIAGGGRFLDLASHTLDFLDYALGPIADVRGFATNQDGRYASEDTVGASFVFASGAHGVGVWSFSSFEEPDRVDVVGTRGRIRFSSFADQPVELIDAGGRRSFAIPHPEHVQQPLVQTVVDALRGEGECPSTGESALRTTRVMDRLLEEYRRR